MQSKSHRANPDGHNLTGNSGTKKAYQIIDTP